MTNTSNLENNICNHFNAAPFEVVIKSEDVGINSLTACVNGEYFDVYFTSDATVTKSLPVT